MCSILGKQRQTERSKKTEEEFRLLPLEKDIKDDSAIQGIIILLKIGRQWKKKINGSKLCTYTHF